MMADFKWTRELVKHLIIQIEQRENLYNLSHRDYRNKIKRDQSIYRVVEELRKLNPRVTRDIVKKKFHTLRTQFQKECRTLAAEERKKTITGENGDDRYSPKLWCFEELSFLKNHSYMRSSVSEKQERAKAPITLKPVSASVPVSLSSSYTVSTPSPAPKVTPSTPSPLPRPPPLPRPSPIPRPSPPPSQATSEYLFTVPSAPASQISYTPPFKKVNLTSSVNRDQEIHVCATCPFIEGQESEYDKMGKIWGSEMRKMTAQQQIFAKRAIAEILFEGQLGTLHRNSVMISHVEALYDSPYHDPLNTEQIDECL